MDAPFFFLDQKGVERAVPREWRPATIVLACPPALWESARLTLQGEPLPLSLRKIGGETRMVADWARTGSGHYRLALDAGAFSERHEFTVQPEKISSETLNTLLADLETRLPLSIALKLQRGGGLAGYQLPESHESTIAQEVQRLRRALRGTPDYLGLIDVLQELAGDPHVVLRGAGIWQIAERARRPQVTSMRQAMLTPGNLGANRRPLRVIDERIDPHVDTNENRLLRLYHDQIERRLRRLLPHRDLGEDHRAEINSLRGQLQRARRGAGWLDDVRPDAAAVDRISMVLLKRPPYRSALSGWLEFHRSVTVRFDHPALDAPLQELPTLYEQWGTLMAIDALLAVAISRGYLVRQHQLFGRDGQDLYLRLFPKSEALLLRHPANGNTVRLLVQYAYHSQDPIHSVTYEQRPDVAIEVVEPSGSRSLIVLDPKYKLDGDEESGDGKPTKVDIDKMHAYRDAIRNTDDERVVRHAAILYPGPTVHWGAGIAALSAIPAPDCTLPSELASLFGSMI